MMSQHQAKRRQEFLGAYPSHHPLKDPPTAVVWFGAQEVIGEHIRTHTLQQSTNCTRLEHSLLQQTSGLHRVGHGGGTNNSSPRA
ncbi:conserved hypothetical protein [Ricinus communis]|uniref:Uncharacterized protein n=1 Tax=Ricinus communis TaxID=3988 RepID=B9SNA4_RICCO|nr:conserved hypothetical protein [Ricinus communis]